MTFAFLAPLTLALGVLLVGPFLAHLTRQTIREEIPFGAFMLLERLEKRLQRRRRLSDRALLALRLLAIGAVLLAAARPELRWPEVADSVGGTGRIVVVLDRSLSMDQRLEGDSAFRHAQSAAAAQVRALAPGVRVVLIAVGSTATAITADWTDDTALVGTLIEELPPSSGATDLHGALVIARTLLAGLPGEVLIYTDESGPGTIEACAGDLERLLALGSSVLPRVYAATPRRNVVVTLAEYGDGVEGGTVAVHLVNYGPDAREVPTSVYLPGGERITAFVLVPGAAEDAPGTAETRFTVPRQAEGGVARVEIDDPDLPLDNTRYFHLPRVGAGRVLVVDGDPGSSPTRSEVYFLERALAPWGVAGPAVDVVSSAGVATLDPTRHGVAWLANVADPGGFAPTLVDFVRGGGGLVIGMGENVTAERYNTALVSLLPAPLRRTRDLVDLADVPGVPLAPPDLTHELFRVFARGGAAEFGAVRTRRVMTVEPVAESDEVRTLLKYTDGVPALLERRIGAGRVLLWTGTLDLGWGNLPLQAVFAPLVQRITTVLGGDVGGTALAIHGEVDSVVTVPLPRGPTPPEITGPDDKLVASTVGDGTVSFVPTRAGEYRAQLGDSPPFARVAVNTVLAESDIRAATSIVAAQAKIAPEAALQRASLSEGALAVAACALLAGAVLAGRSGEQT